MTTTMTMTTTTPPRHPLPPLDTVGVGPPGPDFEREANLLAGAAAFELRGVGREAWVRDDDPAMAPSLKYLYGRALYAPGFQLPVQVKGHAVPARFVAGTYLDIDEYGPVTDFRDPGTGMPVRPEVLLLGKNPGRAEVEAGANFVGASSDLFREALTAVGVPKAVSASWYATNVVKHEPVDPGSDRLAASLIANCRPLLAIELRLLLPRFILCLGGDALKALLPSENLTRMLGRVVDYAIPLHRQGQEPRWHHAKVMAAVHPAAVYRDPKRLGDLRGGLGGFWDLIRDRPVVRAETVRHVACYSAASLDYELNRAAALHADRDGRITLALDGEWQGDYPIARLGGDAANYLRTWQISAAPGEAIVVVLRDEAGRPCFDGGIEAAARLLGRFLTADARGSWRPRIGGHWFRADLPWAIRQLGIDLRPGMAAAADPAATRDAGFDTGYMAHAHQEDLGVGNYSLKSLAARRCRMAPWDLELDAWKKEYVRQQKLNDDKFEGFGACPDRVLVGTPVQGTPESGKVFVANSYSGFDADATLRLERLYNGHAGAPGLLDQDDFGLSSRIDYWLNMASFLPFLEMEMHGIAVDRRRADDLVDRFVAAYALLLERFRGRIRWPGFNPGSANQCRELLFGERYNGSRDPETGAVRRLRPDWASPRAGTRPANPALAALNPPCLALDPIKAAGKKGLTWDRVRDSGQEHLYNPSTDKSTLSILGWKEPRVAALRDLRYVAQVLKGVLRKPRHDDAGGYVRDDDDLYEYDGGLVYWTDRRDGRVRSHFFPVETGRISSSRPNLTNCSKSREADYRQILGYVEPGADGRSALAGKYVRELRQAMYVAPVRSILRAAPGKVLVEADFKSAELCILAWFANSPQMRADVERSFLPDDDPRALDMHAQTACVAFGLDCAPTKKGLAAIGKVHLRTGGKTVNYGVVYGLGDEALAIKCAEEGHAISTAEAARLRQGYFDLYPENREFLDACRWRVLEPGWLTDAFGRHRRFYAPNDKAAIAEMQRAAMNFPIQGTVSSAMRLGMLRLYDARNQIARDQGVRLFDLLLQIHDSVLVECRPEHADQTIALLERCLSAENPIQPAGLDGRSPSGETFHLQVDVEVFERWGEPLEADRLRELGISWTG